MPEHLRYRINILTALKDAGYTTGRIRKEHIIGEQMLQNIRKGDMPSWKTLETICGILNCQPGDLIEYVPENEKAPDASPSEAGE